LIAGTGREHRTRKRRANCSASDQVVCYGSGNQRPSLPPALSQVEGAGAVPFR